MEIFQGMPTMASMQQLLVVSKQDDETSGGIHSYDVQKDKWRELMQFPSSFRVCDHSIVLDRKTNKLYVSGNPNPMSVFDLNSKRLVSQLSDWSHIPRLSTAWSHHFPGLVAVEETVHVVADEHAVFVEEANSMERVVSFPYNAETFHHCGFTPLTLWSIPGPLFSRFYVCTQYVYAYMTSRIVHILYIPLYPLHGDPTYIYKYMWNVLRSRLYR